MSDTTGRQKINSTFPQDYNFTFYRSITYNITKPINRISIILNIEREKEKMTLYYLNKLLNSK